MNNHYFYFDFPYNVDPLRQFFKQQRDAGLTQPEKVRYEVADLSLFDQQLPLFDEMQMDCILNDCMLGVITQSVGLHCNPGNNGLVILPIDGGIDFDFYEYEPPIENGLTSFMPWHTTQRVTDTLKYSLRNVMTPIAFNGRLIHDYRPTGDSALFYAVKIPLLCEWKTIRGFFA